MSQIHLRDAKPGDIAERIIATGCPDRARLVAEELLNKPRVVNTYRGYLAYTGSYKDVDVTVISHGIGTPSSLIVFEELWRLGARIIIRLGTCGALHPGIEVGDIVVPTTAAHYPGGAYYQYYGEHACPPSAPSYEVLDRLVKRLRSTNSRLWVGPVLSSDAFYSETPGFAEKWRSRGVLCVEMECSALFMLSAMRGFMSGAVLVVSNSLVKPSVHAGLEELRDSIIRAATSVLDVLVELDTGVQE